MVAALYLLGVRAFAIETEIDAEAEITTRGAFIRSAPPVATPGARAFPDNRRISPPGRWRCTQWRRTMPGCRPGR